VAAPGGRGLPVLHDGARHARAALDHDKRYNFFPASPLCSLNCVLAGEWHVIASEAELQRPWTSARMPPLSFSGAQLTAPVSWNPAATFAVILVFYPDALAAVTGVSLAPFTGRTVAAQEALPQMLLAPCRRTVTAVRRGAVEDGVAALQDEIAILWTAGGRPAGRPSGYGTGGTASCTAPRALRPDVLTPERAPGQVMGGRQRTRPAGPWPDRGTLCAAARGHRQAAAGRVG
jgi:hypothetical protein